MKVILQQNVQKLGKAGDIVEAAAGYFRNYLQPRRLAVLATEGTLKKREEDLEALKRKAELAYQAAVDLGEKISLLGGIKIVAKAGEGGKLYGKVTHNQIAQELSKILELDIDKKLIKSNDDIGSLGSFKVFVKVAPEVQSELTVDVVSELAPAYQAKAAEVSEEPAASEQAPEAEEEETA